MYTAWRNELKDRGLYQKYIITRTDGKPVDAAIVLELKDANTWSALREYARTVRRAGYVLLADDIERVVPGGE